MKGELNKRDQCYADIEALEHNNKELLAKNEECYEALRKIIIDHQVKKNTLPSIIYKIKTILKEMKS